MAPSPPSAPPAPRPRRPLSRRVAHALYSRLAALMPEPATELAFVNPYTLLVAVALSAQATDKSVNRATGPLFQIADSPEKMLALGEDALAAHIRTIGLWRTKARNVIALSQLLLERHGGAVPADLAALQALPGIGRKTANVVMAEAFGAATIAVDTHVFRVANRTGLAFGKTPDQVEAGLERITPPEFKRGAHHWLILHGRYTCLARTPRCPACPIADLCGYPAKTRPAGEKVKARPAPPPRKR